MVENPQGWDEIYLICPNSKVTATNQNDLVTKIRQLTFAHRFHFLHFILWIGKSAQFRPEEVQVFFKTKGPERTILTSDVVKLAGMPPGDYSYDGRDVVLTPEGMVKYPAQNVLAGAAAPIIKGVGILCVSPAVLWRMPSTKTSSAGASAFSSCSVSFSASWPR
jgi:hypothetical protein